MTKHPVETAVRERQRVAIGGLNLKTQLNVDKPAECQAGYGFGNVMRSHPMGESKLKKAKHAETLMTCAGVQTVAGRVQVRWESKSASTPMVWS